MLVHLAIQVAIALATFVILSAIIEAMRRRGFDPVAKLAAIISPSPAPIEEV